MPQSLKQAKNVPLELTPQFIVDYLASLLLKTAPLNYPGIYCHAITITIIR